MVDRRDEVLGGPKSKRTMANGLDLVVHAFDGSVGNASLGPGEDAVEVAPQHLCEFLERLQFRPHRRVDPFGQVLLGTPWLLKGPEQLEGFLQIPGAHQWCVPLDQRGESLLLVAAEIPWILQQQPARSLESRSLLISESAPQVAARRIHRLIEMLDDVKPIKQDLRVWRVFPN